MKRIALALSVLSGLSAFSAQCQESADRWVTRAQKSKMDDRDQYTAFLLARERVSAGGRQFWPSLALRCRDGNAELWFNASTVLESNRNDVSLRLRLDDLPAVPISGGISTDHSAASITYGSQMFPRMAAATRLRIEFTPYRSGPQVAEFNMGRVSEHAEDIARYCRINIPVPVVYIEREPVKPPAE